MKCCICGKNIENDSINSCNPFPLCGVNDYKSRCCIDCDSIYVINARLFKARRLNNSSIITKNMTEEQVKNIIDNLTDIVVFYASDNDYPLNIIKEQNKYLSIKKEFIKYIDKRTILCGHFKLDLIEDSYIIENQ